MLNDEDLDLLVYGKGHKKESRYEELKEKLPELLKDLKKKHVTKDTLFKEYKRDNLEYPYSQSQFYDILRK